MRNTSRMHHRLAGLVVVAVVTAACVTSPARRPAGPRTDAGPPSSALTATALDMRGAPYRLGGETPTGFDCSGFTRYVFGRHGVSLPRVTADQFAIGEMVPRGDLRPGDLVFFSTVAPGPSHVGISLGGNEFVHAPTEHGVVRVERLTSSYWSRRYVGARRIATFAASEGPATPVRRVPRS